MLRKSAPVACRGDIAPVQKEVTICIGTTCPARKEKLHTRVCKKKSSTAQIAVKLLAAGGKAKRVVAEHPLGESCHRRASPQTGQFQW